MDKEYDDTLFDWRYYLETYPDLIINGINTKLSAIRHWHEYGKKEKRIPYDINNKEDTKHIQDNVNNKIAVYTCNFGNYREELDIFISSDFDKNIDYYLFTDDIDIKLSVKKWKIIYTPLLSSDETMDKYRWTTKYIKFVLPDILKKYEYVLWIDSNMMNLSIKYDNILNLIEKYPLVDIFNNKHPQRNTAQEELEITIMSNVENTIPAQQFLNYIKNFKSNFSLPATGIFLRNTKDKTNKAFELCYKFMKIFKLKRDQNIYNFALSRTHIVPLVLPKLNEVLSTFTLKN